MRVPQHSLTNVDSPPRQGEQVPQGDALVKVLQFLA